MLNKLSKKNYFLILALFLVASSKGIIIYNEESLVALSFLCFVVWSFHYFANNVQESLDERSQLIRKEHENFLGLRESSLIQLVNEHKSLRDLNRVFSSLFKFTEQELADRGNEKIDSINFSNILNTKLQQKLDILESSLSQLELALEKSIAMSLDSFLLAKIFSQSPKSDIFAQASEKGINKNKKKRSGNFFAKQIKKSIQLL